MALSFKARKKGTESLCITSTMPARIGFKVQCTDSKHFIFRPVFGVIEAKKSFRISVVRNAHPKKRDKMIVCAAVVSRFCRNN
ncbi:unnamed protein product [Haemonchus placei]|uniref:MSP domain-containing protein n=1 Tax=Haemonchus placei TaxID=6290 RepID=A0A0N4VZU2_HAEPC|nr:unnamed protein product [Haemonchus placei]